MVLIGVVVGVAAIFAMKQGAGPEGGSRDGGACCPLMSGLNVWSTNSWGQVGATNGKAVVRAGESVANRAQ